jgi:hypothetical protein
MAVLALAALGGALTGPAHAQSTDTGIRGTPELIDADVLKFGTQRVSQSEPLDVDAAAPTESAGAGSAAGGGAGAGRGARPRAKTGGRSSPTFTPAAL